MGFGLGSFNGIPEVGFLAPVLDVSTIFEVKFYRGRAKNMSFWLMEDEFLVQITLENWEKYIFTFRSGPGNDLGTISETIIKPNSVSLLLLKQGLHLSSSHTTCPNPGPSGE